MHYTSVILASSILLAGAAPSTESTAPADALFSWRRLPDLPDAIGVAGPYAGVSGGALIVAGGANFPQGMPWEGGKKVWHDRIYVLPRPDDKWITCDVRLPRPLAYGVSLSLDEGVFCLGGGDAERHYAESFLLRRIDGKVTLTDLPPLPRPAAFACGAVLERTIYVAGGLERPDAHETLKVFWALDIDRPREQWRWRQLAPWPGRGRMLAVAGVQDGSFFLIGGVDLTPDPSGGKPRRVPLKNAYRYSPGKGWREIASPPRSVSAAPSPAIPLGQSHLVVLGGDDGSGRHLAVGPSHPGFRREVLVYGTITDAWTSMGRIPAPRVTTPTVAWVKGFVVPSGEVRPGVRSPRVDFLRPVARHTPFGWLNYLTLIGYLACVVLIGCWFSRRNKSTNDFFRGGQRIPWWAAGLSIYATMLSSITYMAVPAKVFATDWSYYFNALAILLAAPVVIVFYLPFYRGLDVTSAYEYLEKRFNLAVRWFGSAAFIALQLGRGAIVLYLPALALSTVSSLNIYACILLMSVLCILYTMFGGIEAVIWTDVIQTIVLLIGAILALVVIVARTDGGVAGLVEAAHANGKFFERVDWGWDTTAATAWVVLLGGLIANIANYTASQDVVQRYLTTKDTKRAGRAIWTNGLMALPSSALFFAVGTALFVFYKTHPRQLEPNLQTDAVFPLFIVQQLPAGVAGLVIAGVFAATQSTLSSSLNSVATCVVTDFYRRLKPSASDRSGLRLARAITVAVGLLVTCVACVMAGADILSLWDSFIAVLGLTVGVLGGLFALGIFTTRANAHGALFGAVVGAIVLFLVQQLTKANLFLYGGIGMITCFVVGWIASWLLGPKPANLAGLTRATRVS